MQKLSIYLSLFLLLFAAACDPKEDRIEPEAPIAVSALKFTVTQTPGYDNEITMESLTPGVIPFWDYGFGISSETKATTIIPFAGEFVIKYYAYSKGGPVVDSTTVQVSANDPNYFSDPMWNLLTNDIAGKTWVWAPDNPHQCMTGGGNFDDVGPGWWKDALDMKAINDKMTFDLNGSYNFSLITPSKTAPGKFKLDVERKKLTIIGSDISKGQNWEYDIITLNENELVLAATHIESWGGFRNFYYFKRQGFNY